MTHLDTHPIGVCVYTPSADGGHARYTWELLNALSRHPSASAFRYELMTSQDLEGQFVSDRYVTSRLLPPLKHRRQFSNRATWIASRITHYARREATFLRWLRGRPDVALVHLQEWTPWLAAPVVRRIRALGKRVVYTVHNVVPHGYPRMIPRALMHHWVRAGWRACDALFVHTEKLAEELSRSLRGSHPPIHVTPHGAWSVAIDDSRRPPLEQRLATKRLLFFGAIRPNKGLDLLLRAGLQLPGYRITVAGEPVDAGYFRGEVLPLIARLREAGMTVDLHDRFIDDRELPDLFAAHGAIVLPYVADFVAQSGVVFLALAHDVPVIASRAGGLAELMSEFEIGQAFSPSTPDALATAVRQLHERPDALALERGLRAAREKYSWHNTAGATVRGYRVTLEVSPQTHDCAVETTPAC